jgi:ATP/maltotriose-dependent transcriptional regulator MalT
MRRFRRKNLRHAIEELPDRLNLFIISRVGPLGQFAHSRVTESMSLVEPQALRLTPEGRSVSAGCVAQSPWCRVLHRLTDGWMVGIVLMLSAAAMAVPGLENTASEVLFDYFASEVFVTRRSLFRTSSEDMILPGLPYPAEGHWGG